MQRSDLWIMRPFNTLFLIVFAAFLALLILASLLLRGKSEKAKRTVLDRLHPGAVILLHAVSKDNAAALGAVIDEARSQGYVFRALTDYVPPV